ncbi:hypothetical protein D3C75_1144090 [compost metagenome]
MKLNLQHAAFLFTLGIADEVQRNLRADWLVHINLVKINMQQIAVQRVPLHILDHHGLFA